MNEITATQQILRIPRNPSGDSSHVYAERVRTCMSLFFVFEYIYHRIPLTRTKWNFRLRKCIHNFITAKILV